MKDFDYIFYFMLCNRDIPFEGVHYSANNDGNAHPRMKYCLLVIQTSDARVDPN